MLCGQTHKRVVAHRSGLIHDGCDRRHNGPCYVSGLQDVVNDANGEIVLKTVATIVKDSQDKHHQKCPMKW